MLTHKICGSASYLKMDEVNFFARKITTELRKKDYREIDADISRLQDSIDVLLKAIAEKTNIIPLLKKI